MSTLSDALAAMDKATPKEWTATARIDPTTRAEAAVWGSDGDMVCMVYGGYEGSEYVEAIDRAKYIASRPDALAWIKKALPWLGEARVNANSEGRFDDCNIIDALIAQATGKKED